MIKDKFKRAGYLLVKKTKYALYSVYAVSVFHCVTNYMVSVILCGGESMEPAVHDGDIWAVECFSRIRGTVQKGDIITVRKPIEADHVVCKRVIAVAGEKITKDNSDTIYIPKGHIWIEGDNKSVSIDSRDYGPVPYALIKNRLMFRIWSKYR